MNLINDIAQLKKWFLSEKRDLPWRKNPSPYRVWVSEVMLQQTRVAVVIPYFDRWMSRFPSIAALAAAPIDEVIKEWEGLGYYSRARFLHEGAQFVVAHYDGVLPSNKELLQKIKGLGPYTIGAILSFAFHQKAAVVDGNIIRVLARYFFVEDDISKSSTIAKIWKLAENLLPEEEPWIVNEALIELGATLCSKKPACIQCPLRKNCKSFSQGAAEYLPIKTKKFSSIPLYRTVTVLTFEDCFLIRRVETGEIMSGLHEFPYFETELDGISLTDLKEKLQKEYQVESSSFNSLPEISHSFTKYRVRLRPFLIECNAAKLVKGYQWIERKNIKKLAFSSGHKRLLDSIVSMDR
jgi:A/G-specific adenine glycosylase